MKLGERRNGRMDACVFFEEGERGKLSSGYFSPRASPRSPVRPIAVVWCVLGGGKKGEEKTERREEYEKSVKAQKNRQNGGLFILVGLTPSKLEKRYHPKSL